MAVRRAYILISGRPQDNENLERATITIEEPEDDLSVLIDPNYPSSKKELLLERLRRIADGQNGNSTNGSKLIALFRIYRQERALLPERKYLNPRADIFMLNFQLRPVCEFEDGKPIPVADKTSIELLW